MNKIFVPSEIGVTEVYCPPSKSFAQRFILASAFSKQKCVILNTGKADDVINISSAVRSLGADVQGDEKKLSIQGHTHKPFPVIHCGESGLGARLMIPAAASFGGNFTITGSGSLLKRPFTDPISFLKKSGFNFSSLNDFLPIEFSGKLKSGNFNIDGKSGSQFISGLLMSLPLCSGDSNLTVENVTSKPYLEITLEVLRQFNIDISHNNYENFFIKGNQKYLPKQDEFRIEGDFSAAAFWLVLGTISSNGIVVKNCNPNSVQGDKIILSVLEKVGAKINRKEDGISINKNQLQPFEFDATDYPDLFPPLVVLASAIEGVSRIKGVSRLVHKESNRLETLQSEFSKANLKMNVEGDVLVIEGTGKLESAEINSHNDHRIAMSGAIASTLTKKGMMINQPEAVSKSYPQFWNDLKIK